jgi:purine-binding chemotaxis protein CheW
LDQENSRKVGGKFLTFFLGNEEYGIEILTVREIIGLLPVTAMPEMPAFVRGLVNLRGKVIPVVELRKKFGMEPVPDTEQTCIIVVQTHETMLGVVVDQVSEVLNIPATDVVDPPRVGDDMNAEYLLGIGKNRGRVSLLLDVKAVFGPESLAALSQMA